MKQASASFSQAKAASAIIQSQTTIYGRPVGTILMANTITTGTILIAERALLPQSLLFESEPYIYGWRRVKNLDIKGLDQIISKAEWNIFYIAGAIETNAFGSDEKKSIRKAIKQVTANLKSKKFNCLEITNVAAKRSQGLPYVSLSAR
jgi:hypothetical protein